MGWVRSVGERPDPPQKRAAVQAGGTPVPHRTIDKAAIIGLPVESRHSLADEEALIANGRSPLELKDQFRVDRQSACSPKERTLIVTPADYKTLSAVSASPPTSSAIMIPLSFMTPPLSVDQRIGSASGLLLKAAARPRTEQLICLRRRQRCRVKSGN